MLVATHTSVRGRRAGVAAGVGLGLMAAIWTMMGLLGLTVVFELFPLAYIGSKIQGATYLLYLAHKMWGNASAPIETRIPPTRRAFRRGFLVNLLNPKSVLFAAAVLVAVFPAGLSVAESFVIVINHFLLEIAFYAALAFCMSTQAVSERYMQAKAHIDRGAAIILGALGIRLVLERGEAP